MRFEVQGMTLLHLGPLQLEVFSRPSAGMMIPSIREQNPADVHEQGRDLGDFSHEAGNGEEWPVGRVIG